MLGEETNNKLRSKYNPNGSALREYQLHLVELLTEFDCICKQIGVQYWISQGTVLGAVRHGGFIPWDDDIDVEMTWSDYKLFCKKFVENDKFALQTIHTDKNYTLPFAKFREKNTEINDTNSQISSLYKYRGPFIDIFYSEYRYKIISQFINMFFVASASILIRFGDRRFNHRLSSFLKFSGDKLATMFRYVLKCFPGKKYGLGYGSHFYDLESNYNDIFPLSTIQFESAIFPAPNNCDGYLKKIYGDYMRIPKEEDRKTHIDS